MGKNQKKRVTKKEKAGKTTKKTKNKATDASKLKGKSTNQNNSNLPFLVRILDHLRLTICLNKNI